MGHARHQEQSRVILRPLFSPRRHGLIPVGERAGGHGLVGQAVVEDQPAAVGGKAAQQRRDGIVDRLGLARARHVAVEVEGQRIEGWIRRRQREITQRVAPQRGIGRLRGGRTQVHRTPGGTGDAGIEAVTAIELLATAVARAGEDGGQALGLLRCQAGTGGRRRGLAAHMHARLEVAGLVVIDHAVLQAVQRITALQQRRADRRQLRIAEGRMQHRLAVGIARRDARHRLQAVHLVHRDARQVEGRIARHHAIKQQRQALRRHHGLAAPGGAAHEVRIFGLAVIEPLQQVLRLAGGAVDRLPAEIKLRLLVGAEARVDVVAAPMATVGGHHRKTTRQCGRKTRHAAQRRVQRAIESAATLEQQPAIPVLRQAQFDAGAIGHVRQAGLARFDGDAEQAMRRQLFGGGTRPSGRRARGHPLHAIDAVVGGGKACQRAAACSGRTLRRLCGGGNQQRGRHQPQADHHVSHLLPLT